MSFGSPIFINEPWERREDDSFASPPLNGSWEQIMLFPEHRGNDYTIHCQLTLLDGQREGEFQFREAGFIARFNDLNRFYYAGVGGFNARRFISLAQDTYRERTWHYLRKQGDLAEVKLSQPFDLRLECLGSKIQLYENNSLVLSAEDSTYRTGYWGFRTVRTQILIEKLEVSPAKQRTCFVVMPFSPPLSFVYSCIKDEVEKIGYRCIREDERALAQIIIDDTKAQLASADLIIADLSGLNPNVYYEVGWAHSLGKKVILLAQSERDVAFDLRHIRYELYETPQQLRQKLRDAISQLLEESDSHANHHP